MIHGTDTSEDWTFDTLYPNYRLNTGGGNDAVIDRSLSDSIIFGGAGNDIIQSYAGNDRLHGNAGDDTFYISNTGDRHRVDVWGGSGRDSIVIESDSAVVASTGMGGGVEVVAFGNGTIVTLHGMDDVHLISHSALEPWN